MAAFQPVPLGGGPISLNTRVDHSVEEVVLAGDVVVQGHRLDPERLAELAHAQRPDAVLVGDIGGNRPVRQLRRALTPRGTLVITGENKDRCSGGMGRNLRAFLMSPWVSQRLTAFIARQNRADLMVLKDLIESGAITPAIDRAYPLAQAPAAIRHLAEGRARGKVVITI